MKKMCIRRYLLNSKKNIGTGKIKIVFLSDVHDKFLGEDGDRILNKIDECMPDIILLGGDLIIGLPDEDVKPAAQFIKRIAEKYPIWYANGNHEQRLRLYPEKFGDKWKVLEKEVKHGNIFRIVNERADISIHGVPVTIYGFEPEARFYKKGTHQTGLIDQLRQVYGEPESDRYTVLLSHNPKYYQDYMEWGADLTLSGHYHGGVILLNKNRGLITPDFHIFSKMCCGLLKQGDCNMIVSAGTGEHTVPFRIHNPREITLIEIEF